MESRETIGGEEMPASMKKEESSHNRSDHMRKPGRGRDICRCCIDCGPGYRVYFTRRGADCAERSKSDASIDASADRRQFRPKFKDARASLAAGHFLIGP